MTWRTVAGTKLQTHLANEVRNQGRNTERIPDALEEWDTERRGELQLGTWLQKQHGKTSRPETLIDETPQLEHGCGILGKRPHGSTERGEKVAPAGDLCGVVVSYISPDVTKVKLTWRNVGGTRGGISERNPYANEVWDTS